ncbi:hypothetical protein ACJJTC_007020 [Scirpophaga incertulas]
MIVDRPNNKLPERLSSIGQGCILTLFGHVSRRDDAFVERLVVQGSVEGTRACGRSPMRWTEEAAVDGSLYECTRRAAVRKSDEGLSSEPPNPDLTTTTTLPRV